MDENDSEVVRLADLVDTLREANLVVIWDDDEYPFDPDRVRIKDDDVITRRYGVGALELVYAAVLDDHSRLVPSRSAAVAWLAMRQHDAVNVPLDRFIGKLTFAGEVHRRLAFRATIEDDEAAEEEASTDDPPPSSEPF